MSSPSRATANAEDDGGEDLDAHPVGAAEAAGIPGSLQLGVGAGDQPTRVATADHARQALNDRAQDPLREGLLQLHLFEALGLNDELIEPLLDDVARARGWRGQR